MTDDELTEIIRLHALWLAGDPEGECADLSEADLCEVDLREAELARARLLEADLCGADLREADLTGADLMHAQLSGARLRGARGLPAAPVIERIHTRLYEAASQPGALDMRHWHICETTHCRAGWVVTLAGEAGRELEAKLGTDAAAALIYMASDPQLECIPDWYASAADALADMRRLAEREAAR